MQHLKKFNENIFNKEFERGAKSKHYDFSWFVPYAQDVDFILKIAEDEGLTIDTHLYNTGLQVSFEGENPRIKNIVEQINDRILSEVDIFVDDEFFINYFLRDIHDDDTLMF